MTLEQIVQYVVFVPINTSVNTCSWCVGTEVSLDPSAITTLASCSDHLRPSVHTDIGWLPSLSVLDLNTRGTITSLGSVESLIEAVWLH
jgi:hypothetical protein